MQESKSCALPLGDSPLGKGGYRDSNPGPPEPQSGALTSCAIPTIYWSISLRTSLKGFEPPTHGLEGRCSIQLSYRLKKRVMGIEPTYPAWKAGVLPLNYTRIKHENEFFPAPKAGALAKLSHTPKAWEYRNLAHPLPHSLRHVRNYIIA